jgi:MFS family permease
MPIGLAALVVIAIILPNFHPPVRTRLRDLDILGIVVFTAATVPILLGLTNKGLTDSQGNLYGWSDPRVGGLLILGVVLLAVFLFIESRARQPIVPLNQFRVPSISVTNAVVFMVSLGMFSAVIFLPRYYQAVRGISATESGYLMWPLLVGLMGTSIGAGILVSRIGRYKWLIVGAMAVFAGGSFLMTHIEAGTPDWMLWVWMFLMGVGIGPSMSVSTVIIQNAVGPSDIGAATSTMTFLRQMGGTIGLAFAGEFFSQQFAQKLPAALRHQGVPQSVIQHFHGAGSATGNLTGVGLGVQLAHTLPHQMQGLIPKIVAGVDNAFSSAIGQVFWLTVIAGIVAFAASFFLPDLTLRGARTSAAPADLVPGGDVPALAADGHAEVAG